MKSPCSLKCKQKCSSVFLEEMRLEIEKHFGLLNTTHIANGWLKMSARKTVQPTDKGLLKMSQVLFTNRT